MLDTFFSDTLDDDMLDQIVAFAGEASLEVQILLLNPFSSLGRSRAASLRLNAVSEVNHALFNICNASSSSAGLSHTIVISVSRSFNSFASNEKLMSASEKGR